MSWSKSFDDNGTPVWIAYGAAADGEALLSYSAPVGDWARIQYADDSFAWYDSHGNSSAVPGGIATVTATDPQVLASTYAGYAYMPRSQAIANYGSIIDPVSGWHGTGPREYWTDDPARIKKALTPFSGFDFGTFLGDAILNTVASAFTGAFLVPDIGIIAAGQGSFIPTFAENAAFAAADAATFGTAVAPAGVVASVAAPAPAPVAFTESIPFSPPAPSFDPIQAAADQAAHLAAQQAADAAANDAIQFAYNQAQQAASEAAIAEAAHEAALQAAAQAAAEQAANDAIQFAYNEAQDLAARQAAQAAAENAARIAADNIARQVAAEQAARAAAQAAMDAAVRQASLQAAQNAAQDAARQAAEEARLAAQDAAQYGTPAAPAGTGPAWSAPVVTVPALPSLPTTASTLPTVSLKDLQTVASLAKTGAGVVAAVMGAGAAANHTGLPTTTPLVQGTPGINQSSAVVNPADAVSAQNPMLLIGLGVLALKLLLAH